MSAFSAPVTIDLGVRETAMQTYLQEGERKAASLSNRDPIRFLGGRIYGGSSRSDEGPHSRWH